MRAYANAGANAKSFAEKYGEAVFLPVRVSHFLSRVGLLLRASHEYHYCLSLASPRNSLL